MLTFLQRLLSDAVCAEIRNAQMSASSQQRSVLMHMHAQANQGRMLFYVLLASDQTCRPAGLAKALYMYVTLHVMFQLVI